MGAAQHDPMGPERLGRQGSTQPGGAQFGLYPTARRQQLSCCKPMATAGPNGPDSNDDESNADPRKPATEAWSGWEKFIAIVALLILALPAALVGWYLWRVGTPPAAGDMAQLIKSIEVVYWPVVALFGVVVFRRPIAGLIARIEQLRGPAGLSANLTKRAESARRAQSQRNRRPTPGPQAPEPAPSATEFQPSVGHTEDEPSPNQDA